MATVTTAAAASPTAAAPAGVAGAGAGRPRAPNRAPAERVSVARSSRSAKVSGLIG